jgi:hypothetical protein
VHPAQSKQRQIRILLKKLHENDRHGYLQITERIVSSESESSESSSDTEDNDDISNDEDENDDNSDNNDNNDSGSGICDNASDNNLEEEQNKTDSSLDRSEECHQPRTQNNSGTSKNSRDSGNILLEYLSESDDEDYLESVRFRDFISIDEYAQLESRFRRTVHKALFYIHTTVNDWAFDISWQNHVDSDFGSTLDQEIRDTSIEDILGLIGAAYSIVREQVNLGLLFFPEQFRGDIKRSLKEIISSGKFVAEERVLSRDKRFKDTYRSLGNAPESQLDRLQELLAPETEAQPALQKANKGQGSDGIWNHFTISRDQTGSSDFKTVDTAKVSYHDRCNEWLRWVIYSVCVY